MRRIGIIGAGSIGSAIVSGLLADPIDGLEIAGLLVRDYQIETCAAQFPGLKLVTTVADLLALDCDAIVEAAGQKAVAQYGTEILTGGSDFYVVSIGALVDTATRETLAVAAGKSGRRVLLPSGALGGFDALLAMRKSGLKWVRFTSTKPPAAWRGTKAEELLDLDSLETATTFFSGPAGLAATTYPKNANLAAAVALAGTGFEDTMVELVADPGTTRNTGKIEASSVDSNLLLVMSGNGSTQNAKTSAITAKSVLKALESPAQTFSYV